MLNETHAIAITTDCATTIAQDYVQLSNHNEEKKRERGMTPTLFAPF